MSINLYIARHGNTFTENQIPVIVGKKTDLNLVESGMIQAKLLGVYFKNNEIKFDAIFSGKLKRQYEFAKIVSSNLQNSPKITISEALDEIDYGLWEGLTPSSLSSDLKYDAWVKKGIWPENFNESEAQRTELLLNWINCIRSQFDANQNILAISSNGIIRQLAKFSDFSSGETLWSRLSDNSLIENLKVRTGAYSQIAIEAFGLSIDLKYWNILPKA